MSRPLVSVITPCYNGQPFVQRALASVKASTYPNIEHIVIDDASTDDSVVYLESLRSQFSFDLLKSSKQLGAANVRNIAIEQSKGKYILPLDCDNYFDENFIETLVNAAENAPENHSPFYTPMVLFGDIRRSVSSRPWSLDSLINAPFINVCSLFSRQAFDAVGGFDGRLPLLEDYDLFLSMAFRGYVGHHVPDVQMYYHIRKDSVSDHFNLRGGEAKKEQIRRYIFEKHLADLERLNLRNHPKVVQYLGTPQPEPTPEPPQPQPEVEPEETLDTRLLHLIPGDAKVVVEFGCDRGGLGVRYKRINPHCTYIGIDENAEAIAVAQTRLDRSFNTPFTQLDSLEIEAESVDCIVFSGNIAQYANSPRILEIAKTWLKNDGQFLTFVPNSHHWPNLLKKLKGDRIEAFEVETIKKLFQRANLSVFEMERCPDSSDDAKAFQDRIKPLLDAYDIDAEDYAKRAETEGYIVRAIKATQPIQRLLVQTLMISTMASDQVRVYQSDRLIRTIPGVRPVATHRVATLNIALPGEEKVFIWQRSRLTQAHAPARQRRLIQAGYLVVVEIDDDPRFWPEHIEEDFITYRSCHCIQTSTEPLADFLRQFNPYVKIFANQLPEIPPPRQYRDDGIVKIFFGALNREADWKPLIDVVNRVVGEFGDRVVVQVIHDKWFFQAIQTPHKIFEPTCSYERYHELLRSCDLALLPLNPTEFNNMKSDLKFIECAGHGVAVLASPTVYARSIVDGKTGLLYETLPEFEQKLRRLIADTPWRRTLAENAYTWVRDNRLISQHYRDRVQWYWEMRSRLPELNEALRQRVPAIFE